MKDFLEKINEICFETAGMNDAYGGKMTRIWVFIPDGLIFHPGSYLIIKEKFGLGKIYQKFEFDFDIKKERQNVISNIDEAGVC